MTALKKITSRRALRLICCLAMMAALTVANTGCEGLEDFITGFECGFNAGANGLPASVCF